MFQAERCNQRGWTVLARVFWFAAGVIETAIWMDTPDKWPRTKQIIDANRRECLRKSRIRMEARCVTICAVAITRLTTRESSRRITTWLDRRNGRVVCG